MLRHARLTLGIFFATLALNIYLFVVIPKGFFPQQDNGRLIGAIQADQDTSFQAMKQKLSQYVEICRQDPAVSHVIAFTGGSGGGATNTGRMFIALKPPDQRKLTADQIIARLRRKTGRVTGSSIYFQPRQDLRIGGRQSGALYQYTLESDDLALLDHWAPKMLAKMRKIPRLTNVNSDQQNSGLDAGLVIDRKTASRLGITPQLIDNTLYDAFGQRQVSTMYTQLNQYHVVMEVAPQFWQNPDTLKEIYVKTPSGAEVPLGAFTHFEASTTPLAVNHQGQFPAVTISFNLGPGVALGDAVNLISDAAKQIGLPASIDGTFQGTAQAFQIVAVQRTDADPGGAAHGLHRAGNPVRELRASAHDPFHAAVGGRRGAAGAAVVRHGPERDRVDRDHPADRHREEERHLDDRLRAGGRAQGGQVVDGRDLPGLPAALPADHDDHDGGAARRIAAGAGHRHGLGAAPAAGHRDRRAGCS